MIHQPFPYIFSPDFVSGWNALDTTLSSAVFAALRRVEIEPMHSNVPGAIEARVWINKALPNLYQQRNIWVSTSTGYWNPGCKSSLLVSSVDSDVLTDMRIAPSNDSEEQPEDIP